VRRGRIARAAATIYLERFGRDFLTADGERLMIVAITPRQWSGLVQALAIGAAVTALEKTTGVSFAIEGARYIHRETLFQIVEAAVRARRSEDLAAAFDAANVCWSRYQALSRALKCRRQTIRRQSDLLPRVACSDGHLCDSRCSAACSQRGSPQTRPSAPTWTAHRSSVVGILRSKQGRDRPLARRGHRSVTLSPEDIAEAAVAAARRYLLAAREVCIKHIAPDGRTDLAAAERGQRMLHGLAWIATLVEALNATNNWAMRMGRFGGVDALVLRIGFGEYLSQLLGGLPMSQNELVRPVDLQLDDAAAELAADPAVRAFLQSGNVAEARASLVDLICRG